MQDADTLLRKLLAECFCVDEHYGFWDGGENNPPTRLKWKFNECFDLAEDKPELEAELRAFVETPKP